MDYIKKFEKILMKEFPSSRLINGKYMENIMGKKDYIEKNPRTYFVFNELEDIKYDSKYNDDIIYTLKKWEEENPMDKFTLCVINTTDVDMNRSNGYYYNCKNKSIQITRSIYNYKKLKYDRCVNTIYFIGEDIKIKKLLK